MSENNKLVDYPNIGSNGYLNSWAGKAVKLYNREQKAFFINQDNSESSICDLNQSFCCNYCQAGLLLAQQQAGVLINLLTLKFYETSLTSVAGNLVVTPYGLSIPNRMLLKVMGV